MRLAKIVFWCGGIWGILVLVPLYFMLQKINMQTPPAITHPEFYYGFVGVALAWQFAFILIATDPVRFKPMMLIASTETEVARLTKLLGHAPRSYEDFAAESAASWKA